MKRRKWWYVNFIRRISQSIQFLDSLLNLRTKPSINSRISTELLYSMGYSIDWFLLILHLHFILNGNTHSSINCMRSLHSIHNILLSTSRHRMIDHIIRGYKRRRRRDSDTRTICPEKRRREYGTLQWNWLVWMEIFIYLSDMESLRSRDRNVGSTVAKGSWRWRSDLKYIHSSITVYRIPTVSTSAHPFLHSLIDWMVGGWSTTVEVIMLLWGRGRGGTRERSVAVSTRAFRGVGTGAEYHPLQ